MVLARWSYSPHHKCNHGLVEGPIEFLTGLFHLGRISIALQCLLICPFRLLFLGFSKNKEYFVLHRLTSSNWKMMFEKSLRLSMSIFYKLFWQILLFVLLNALGPVVVISKVEHRIKWYFNYCSFQSILFQPSSNNSFQTTAFLNRLPFSGHPLDT